MHHDNIIRLIDIYKASNDQDIYLLFEFVDTDLSHAIRYAMSLITEITNSKKNIYVSLCGSLWKPSIIYIVVSYYIEISNQITYSLRQIVE